MEPAPTSSTPSMGLREWVLLLTLSLLWGGSFFFGKIAVGEWPPLVVVLSRVGLAALVLYLVLRARGLSMAVGRTMWLAFFGMGLLNNLIPFSLIFWGQTQLQSGVSAILNATTPLFGVIVAHLFATDEKATPLKIAGVLAGIAGVAILMGPDALGGLQGALLPQLACLGAALSYGFAGLYGRRFRGLPPLVTAAGQLTATTIMTLPLVLILTPPSTLPVPSWNAGMALVALALLSTALAYVIFFEIMRRAGGSNAMLVTFLIPVSAILMGVGLLGEVLLPRHFAGMGAIFLGLALIDGRLFRRGEKNVQRA
ncbi:DMT family transporter [Bosea sp. PAMC 26642]|uniref:DMT family transporter n=1 Tax=Bosea sp. (strain PAMC 26642) TaxID=1792307 RepID=UPI00076FFD7D|nr:DMT family transporter [Bosea sp. PAMC 26642]AMJ59004.1 ABC transporter permease [Bosea sp. PAMC 26642]